MKTFHRVRSCSLASCRWPLVLLLAYFGSTVAAVFLAPTVYSFLHFCHSRLSWNLLEYIAGKPYIKIFDRVRLFMLFLGLLFILLKSGACRVSFFKRWSTCYLFWIFLGAGFVLLLAALQIGFSENFRRPLTIFAIFRLLIGAVFVAFLEEFFFRGVFFWLFRRAFSSFVALLLVSFFFAHAHFHSGFGVGPSPGEAVSLMSSARVGWCYLLGSFYNFDVCRFFSLFLLSYSLCLLTVYYGTLFPATCFHLGIVGVMLLYRKMYVLESWNFLFGSTDLVDSPFCILLEIVLIFSLYVKIHKKASDFREVT